MADTMTDLVLSRIGEDIKTTRWSAGLAMVCFAPPMPDRFHKEVHRRLAPILAACGRPRTVNTSPHGRINAS